MATIKDIAKNLGLSTSTVSRALNGSKSISDKTKEEVNAEAKRLRFTMVSEHAQVEMAKHGQMPVNTSALTDADALNAMSSISSTTTSPRRQGPLNRTHVAQNWFPR